MDVRQSIINKLSQYTYDVYEPLLESNRDESFWKDEDPVMAVDGELDNPYKIATFGLQIIHDEYFEDENLIIDDILEYDNYDLLSDIIAVWFPNSYHRLSPDVQLNLLHYMSYNSEKYRPDFLTNEEREYLINTNLDDLLVLLGPNYNNKPIDQASLLFAALSGKSSPLPNIQDVIQRYSAIKSYMFSTIYVLQNKIYGLLDHHPLPIHVRLAFEKESPIEFLYITLDDETIDVYIEKYGMFIPNDTIENQEEDKFFIFDNDIFDYARILSRRPYIKMPDPMELLALDDPNRATSMLKQFTSRELFEEYYHTSLNGIASRRGLISIIVQNATLPRWRINHHQTCANDDNINIVTGQVRNIDNQTLDKNDVILSYGTLYYYNCYKLSELMESFRQVDDRYIFTNPDYNPNIDQLTPLGRIEPEFDVEQVEDLERLLLYEGYRDIYPDFLNFLQEGIEYKRRPIDYLQIIDEQIELFRNLNNDTQIEIILFLCWLFFYSMYMRFWKGPNNPYPIINLNREGRGDVCLPTVRDEHVLVQQGVLHRLKESLSKEALRWIDHMYIVDYDFNERLFDGNGSNLTETLNNVEHGIHCMGIAADELLSTAYYYLTNMYSVDINEILIRYLPTLLNLEEETILTILNDIDNTVLDNSDKIRTLQQQLANIGNIKNNGINQLPFNIEGLTYNIHVD